MYRKSPLWLEDIIEHVDLIGRFAGEGGWDAYASSLLLRSAVERQISVIAEALLRIERHDTETAQKLTCLREMVGLRNRLAHGYDDDIDDRLVWRAVQELLPALRSESVALLADADS